MNTPNASQPASPRRDGQREQVRHTVISGDSSGGAYATSEGTQTEPVMVEDRDWAAWSAGYEAGLRDGIATSHLKVTVELVPTGPVQAGMRLWQAQIAADLYRQHTYPRPALSGEEILARARASWGLPADPPPTRGYGYGHGKGTA